jgi:hypothetical protein
LTFSRPTAYVTGGYSFPTADVLTGMARECLRG